MSVHRRNPLWGHFVGYRRCRPRFTVGLRSIPAAGSMTCSISCVTRRRCWCRLIGSRATTANTPGVDGLTAAHVEEVVGLSGFLDDLRTCLKEGSFRPLPVRERKIPKPGGSGKL